MAGFSADIELLRPVFTVGDTPGVEAPRIGTAGTVQVGTLLQFVDQPLVLYRYGEEDSAIIQSRAALAVGASLDFSRRFGGRIVLPMAYDFAGEGGEFLGQPFGGGDLQAGVRAHLWQLGPLELAAHGDLLFPVGAQGSWKGETGLRFVPGLLASVGLGPVSVRSDTGVMLRQPVETGQDLLLTHEWVENAAIVGTIWEDRAWLHGGIVSRVGLGTGTSGIGEAAAEAIVGAQFRPHSDWTVDVGLGRGVTEGYGTSRLRLFAGLTWMHVPRPPTPDPVVATLPPLERISDEMIIEQIALAPPEAPALARVEQDQILIRDPIQFELGKDTILPVSLPTLQFVGKLMAEHPELAHLVIEGHASEEGSFYYNYDLAKMRADSVWRALVAAGVSPTRLSTRSMGEVEPVQIGQAETQLADNRRVVFHIVRRLRPDEVPAPYKLDIRQPWTGDPQTIPAPPAITLPIAAPPANKTDIPTREDFEERDESEPRPEPAPPAETLPPADSGHPLSPADGEKQ